MNVLLQLSILHSFFYWIFISYQHHGLVHLALTEAAERFKELQTEKEMRQLQEDRKNDKKPPPYRHIRVQVLTFVLLRTFILAILFTFSFKIQPIVS